MSQAGIILIFNVVITKTSRKEIPKELQFPKYSRIMFF